MVAWGELKKRLGLVFLSKDRSGEVNITDISNYVNDI